MLAKPLLEITGIPYAESIFFASSNALAAGATNYVACTTSLGQYSTLLTNEKQVECRYNVSRAGTIDNLIAHAEDAAGAGEGYTFTVRKNGADQSLTYAVEWYCDS